MKTLALALSLIALCGSSIVRYDNPQAPSSCNCRPIVDEFPSICGSDGHVYHGWCWFRCAQFKNPSLLPVDFKYCKCDIIEPEKCKPNQRTHCRCSPYVYQPVCASNGKIYSSPCWLQCDQQVHPDLTMVRYGDC